MTDQNETEVALELERRIRTRNKRHTQTEAARRGYKLRPKEVIVPILGLAMFKVANGRLHISLKDSVKLREALLEAELKLIVGQP